MTQTGGDLYSPKPQQIQGQKCPACDGNGELEGTAPPPCPRCQGTGIDFENDVKVIYK